MKTTPCIEPSRVCDCERMTVATCDAQDRFVLQGFDALWDRERKGGTVTQLALCATTPRPNVSELGDGEGMLLSTRHRNDVLALECCDRRRFRHVVCLLFVIETEGSVPAKAAAVN